MLELTDGLKALLKETAKRLKSHERRRFMAQTVEELGRGGQRLAERELGWHRDLMGYYPSKVGKTKPLKKSK